MRVLKILTISGLFGVAAAEADSLTIGASLITQQ